jgi:hypothetical protein
LGHLKFTEEYLEVEPIGGFPNGPGVAAPAAMPLEDPRKKRGMVSPDWYDSGGFGEEEEVDDESHIFTQRPKARRKDISQKRETVSPDRYDSDSFSEEEEVDDEFHESTQARRVHRIYISKILNQYSEKEALDIDKLNQEPSTETKPSTERPNLDHSLDITRIAGNGYLLLTPFQKQSVFDMDVMQSPRSRPYSTPNFSFNLPQLAIGQNTFLSFIRPQSGDKWLKVVWNKGLQTSYSILDVPSQQLPVMIERKRTLAGSQMEVEDERSAKRIRAHAEDDEEE